MLDSEIQFGFKEISNDNFMRPEQFIGYAPPKIFLDLILDPKLNDNVPEKVQAMFEAARGAIAYGYFFYPLFALGAEQLSRFAEAAAMIRCQQEGAPPGVNSFSRYIEWLKSKQIIVHDFEQWIAIKDLRNITSHPESQQLYTVGITARFLQSTTRIINELYSDLPSIQF